jgi:AcrR family transcriptional regulator
MNVDQESPQRRILYATISCIEEEGVSNVTTRRIAARAGVNVAAINYYFRSKDALIDRALDETLVNAFDWDDYAASADATPHDRIVHIFEYLLNGTLVYPGITRTHLLEAPAADGGPGRASAALEEFLERVQVDLVERGLKLEPATIRTRLLQAYGAVILAAVTIQPLLSSYAGVDSSDPRARHDYIDSLVTALFG